MQVRIDGEETGVYGGAALTALAGVLGVVTLVVMHRTTAVSAEPLESLPFLSGHRPEQHALSLYHVRCYLTTLVFLAFDVEMLFMYPWALVVARMGAEAVVEMFGFLGVLLVAVMWARREGAFRWA